MELVVEQVKGKVDITVLRVTGKLDGSTYLQFIDEAKKQYAAGARDFIIDLTQVSYLSSAGLTALHSVVKLTRGEASSDATGWDALHALGREQGKGGRERVKLLNPQPQVHKVLELAGVIDFLPVFTDLDAAIASF